MPWRNSFGRTGEKTSFWKEWGGGFVTFLKVFLRYLRTHLLGWFGGFEDAKGFVVGGMYRQRGKYAGAVVHAGMVLLLFLGVTLGPTILARIDDKDENLAGASFESRVGVVLGADEEGVGGQAVGGEALVGAAALSAPVTVESDKPRAEVVEYKVQEGDTLSTIAEKFGVSMDTIRWANDDVKSIDSIKPGQTLKIPPVTGIVHTVKSGETIYSIAKKYEADAQSIVDFPFNSFTNDETFALAIGQAVVVPDGVVPAAQPWSPTSAVARILTPDAGAVSATGSWSWPAAGRITQPWRPWHKGIDIANKSGGAILAADSGTVVVAGWPDNWGYGNRVMIDHGNGFVTLYAHMSKISVSVGQTVNRGNVIGSMGSTGRSTGVHLHFEVRAGGVGQNPLAYLK